MRSAIVSSANASKSYRLYLANSPDAPNREQVRKLIDEMDLAAKETRANLPPPGSQPPSPTGATSAPATPTVAAVQSAAPARPSPWYRSTTGWALTSSGIVLAGVAAGLLGAAVGEHNASTSATTQASFDDHHANVVHFQQAGWPLLGVGGALVVAGVAVLALHAKGHR